MLARSDTPGVSNYLFNGHGDVVHLTGSSGAVTRTYDYDAFGNEKAASAGDGNPFRYCGEYFDRETGSYYLRARYYNPVTGRFLTADMYWHPNNMIYGDNPVEMAIGVLMPSIYAIMQNTNLYAYCINNPIVFFDPWGAYILTIYSDPEDGHSFVEITNDSDETIMVGVYELASNESVTVGTFGNQKGHNGIFYNLEASGDNKNQRGRYVSLTMEFGATELRTINKFIKNHDTWNLALNCAWFAVSLWNSVSDTKLSASNGSWYECIFTVLICEINTSANLAESIKRQKGYETGRKFVEVSPSTNKIGYASNGVFKGGYQPKSLFTVLFSQKS